MFGRYGDSLLDHDHQVGRVLDALEELGIVNDTIVVWVMGWVQESR